MAVVQGGLLAAHLEGKDRARIRGLTKGGEHKFVTLVPGSNGPGTFVSGALYLTSAGLRPARRARSSRENAL